VEGETLLGEVSNEPLLSNEDHASSVVSSPRSEDFSAYMNDESELELTSIQNNRGSGSTNLMALLDRLSHAPYHSDDSDSPLSDHSVPISQSSSKKDYEI
jgi:hypothetical protein